MLPLYILKIGGSVATYKNRPGVFIRRSLLEKIATEIKRAQQKKPFRLILVHGAGSAGHQLAHQYKLKEGTRQDEKKWKGALLSRIANQKFNTAVTEIFVKKKLNVVPTNTAAVIIQKNKSIDDCYLPIIQEALKNNCIPLLYGEMVFDRRLGMTICSGDAIVPYLAKKLKASRLFFASDIDGIFDQDPYQHPNAKLIEYIFMKDIHQKSSLGQSHSLDVTGGLMGKINQLQINHHSGLKSIEIFNGLKPQNYFQVFLDQKFPHTTIKTRKSSR